MELSPLLFKILSFPKIVPVNVKHHCTLGNATNKSYQINAKRPGGFSKSDLPADSNAARRQFLSNSGIPGTKKLVLLHLQTATFATEQDGERGSHI